jgi:hypothetical protein
VPGDLEQSMSVHDSIVINGHTVTPGTELSIKGERGRFRFIKHVQRRRPSGEEVEWIDVWGGPKHSPQLRSFRPDRVRTVHRINTTDKNLLKERKAAKK